MPGSSSRFRSRALKSKVEAARLVELPTAQVIRNSVLDFLESETTKLRGSDAARALKPKFATRQFLRPTDSQPRHLTPEQAKEAQSQPSTRNAKATCTPPTPRKPLARSFLRQQALAAAGMEPMDPVGYLNPGVRAQPPKQTP